MKNVFLLVILLIFGVTNLSAQKSTVFGVEAGYVNLAVKASVKSSDLNAAATVSESGFYIGFLTEFSLDSEWKIQPELLYTHVGGDINTDFLYIPVLVKYYIPESGFHLLAGPQFTYGFDMSDEVNAFGMDLTFGAGYDFTENFFATARYAFGITNRLKKDEYDGIKLHFNTFNVGIGYKF